MNIEAVRYLVQGRIAVQESVGQQDQRFRVGYRGHRSSLPPPSCLSAVVVSS